MRTFFMSTQRIGFSLWQPTDLDLANLLWGEPAVTKYISANGIFTEQAIEARLAAEIAQENEFSVQYFPIFERLTEDFIGCCGARPVKSQIHTYEIGFHLRKQYWGQGYGLEAAQAVIDYCFTVLHSEQLIAGHHPENANSKKLLTKLGFCYTENLFYEPTGLYHPSYTLYKPLPPV